RHHHEAKTEEAENDGRAGNQGSAGRHAPCSRCRYGAGGDWTSGGSSWRRLLTRPSAPSSVRPSWRVLAKVGRNFMAPHCRLPRFIQSVKGVKTTRPPWLGPPEEPGRAAHWSVLDSALAACSTRMPTSSDGRPLDAVAGGWPFLPAVNSGVTMPFLPCSQFDSSPADVAPTPRSTSLGRAWTSRPPLTYQGEVVAGTFRESLSTLLGPERTTVAGTQLRLDSIR